MPLIYHEMPLFNPKMPLFDSMMSLFNPKMPLFDPKMPLLTPKMSLLTPKMRLNDPKMQLMTQKIQLLTPKMQLNDKLHGHHDSFKIHPTYNTDNMGKLFPALRDKLSRFLLLLLLSRQICNNHCTRTRASARNLNPATWYPDSYRDSASEIAWRHCASAHLSNFCYQDNLSATYKNCNAIAPAQNINCTRTTKTRAIAFLHRDIPIAIGILAKVPGPDSYRDCPDAASGNRPALQAGSIAKIA